MTTLSSKLLLHDRRAFAELAVKAVLRLRGSGNLEYIKIIKKPGGTLGDSFIADGMVLEKTIATSCARSIENPRVPNLASKISRPKSRVPNFVS